MKKLTFIIALFCYFFGFSQEPLVYTGVVETDSTLTKNDLYINGKTWFAESFRSAQDVLQMEDKEASKLIGKSNIEYNSNVFLSSDRTRGWIRFTVNLQVKDGKYKYEISNIIHDAGFSFGYLTTDFECPYEEIKGGKKWKNKVWTDIKTQTDQNIIPLIESLKITMSEKPEAENDW